MRLHRGVRVHLFEGVRMNEEINLKGAWKYDF